MATLFDNFKLGIAGAADAVAGAVGVQTDYAAQEYAEQTPGTDVGEVAQIEDTQPILANAASATVQQIGDAATAGVSQLMSLVKWAIVGVVALAVVVLAVRFWPRKASA